MTLIVQRVTSPGSLQDGLSSVAFPLVLPANPSARRITLAMSDLVGVIRPPYGGPRQTQEWIGAERWSAQIELPPMKKGWARAWIAMMAALRGQAGTVLVGDSSHTAPQGTGAGTPLVSGANTVRSRTLVTKGWSNSSLVLRSGDYIQVGSGVTQRIYMNLTDVTSSGAGAATLQIWPTLREALADNAGIVTSACKGSFALASNDRSIEMELGIHHVALQLVEAV